MKTITNLQKCKTCGYLSNFQNNVTGCLKFKIEVNPEKDFCSRHINGNDLIECPACHQKLLPSNFNIFIIDNHNIILCNNCASHLNQCTTCVHQQQCGFKMDRSEPQVVMKTVRQGMMTMQTQVKNPNLVRKHCLNCICSYGLQGDCCKDQNGEGCKNWQIIPELMQ